jgi:2-iminoacetate synthase ThiH
MSVFVADAIARAGLGAVAVARLAGDVAAADRARALLASADILALGALADQVRAAEVGDAVRVRCSGGAERARPEGVTVVSGTGLELLRAVAIARITSAPGARIAVDWDSAGLEVAQVALGFGANELWGAVANKRGLAIAGDATKRVKGRGDVSLRLLKRDEIAALVARCKRTPVVDDEPREAASEGAHDV